MSYLHRARAGDTEVAAEGGAACPMTRGGAAAAGGEEGLTRGLKGELCPPRVFAMVGLGVGEGG